MGAPTSYIRKINMLKVAIQKEMKKMKLIFKELLRHWKIIICIIVLLAVQAVCDLSLPDYTSKIINIGVQQGGIVDKMPKAIRESKLEEMSLFANNSDGKNIKEYYTLIKKGDSKYTKKYPINKNEDIYILKKLDKKEQENFEDKFLKPMLVSHMIANDNDISKSIAIEIKKDLPENLREMDIISILKNIPEDKQIELQNSLNEKFKEYPEMIIEQGALEAVKIEYTKLGMDMEKIQNDYIWLSGVKMLSIALFSMVTTIFVGFLGAKIAAKIGQNLRKQVFDKVLSYSTSEFKKFGVASLITRSTNDINQVQMILMFMLRVMFYAPIVGIGGVIKALNTNASMAWIIALAVSIITSMMVFLFVVGIPKFKLVQKLIDKLNLVTREILNGIPVIRAFSNQKHEEKRFDKANKDLKKNSLFVSRVMGLMMPSMMFVMNAICILIVWKGAHGINDGVMQIGDMMAYIQYTMQIIMAFLFIGMLSIMLPRSTVSATRINEILITEPSIKNPIKPKTFSSRIKGKVEFKNVSFKYPDSDEDVLTDISFKVNKGETFAFIGSTGSGKSTLINLIPRLFDVTKGEILINDINIKDVTEDELHKKIGFVPQKGILFKGSIETNIKYGNKELSIKEVKKVAEIAQATDFINSKKKKYKEQISQGGTNVSGGQKQRLQIARAIATSPEIYIFDDSFSALDFKTDSNLRKALFNEMNEATILIVAQRVSTIMNADNIIVLDEGKIVGMGKHKELLKTCNVYNEIAVSQLTKEELENE